MPEKWRMEPGTLKERWSGLGFHVLWSDAVRAYEVYVPSACMARAATRPTVMGVEAWIQERLVVAPPELIT